MGYSCNRKTGAIPLEYVHKRHHDTSHDMEPRSIHLFNPSTWFKSSSSQMANPKGKEFKCFKCQQPGHMAYNYPRKNLHISRESKEEPKPPKQGQIGNSFDYGAYDPVDLKNEELDGPLVSVMRHILQSPKLRKKTGAKLLFFTCWFDVGIKLKNSLMIVGAS